MVIIFKKGDVVVCDNITHCNKELTLFKKYIVLDISGITIFDYITIKNDYGCIKKYSRLKFISLKQYRLLQLKELLYGQS